MIQDFHGKSDGITRPGKSRGHRNSQTMKASIDSALFKEAREVAASIDWEQEDSIRLRRIALQDFGTMNKYLQMWLEVRMDRDSKRLVALRASEVQPVPGQVNVRNKKSSLR